MEPPPGLEGQSSQQNLQRGPNPNRIVARGGFRPTDAGTIDLSPQARRQGGRVGARHTTITILSAPSQGDRGVFLIGICIRDDTGLRFDAQPTPGPLDLALPLALENAVLRCPALRDLIVTTPYKLLWDSANHTPSTRDWVRRHGCRLTHAHPMPYDLGNMLALVAARGGRGPRLVDYHLYTASITDGERSYVSAVLYGRSKAYAFTQTLAHHNLAAAEAVASHWAFTRMPEHSEVMVCNANPVMREIWTTPQHAPPEVRDALHGLAQQIRLRNIRFVQQAEPFVADVARAAREMASHAYAGANLRVALPGQERA